MATTLPVTSYYRAIAVEQATDHVASFLSHTDLQLFALMCGDIIEAGIVYRQNHTISLILPVLELHKQQVVDRIVQITS